MDPIAMVNAVLRRSPLGVRTILEIDLDQSVLSVAPGNPLEALRALNAPTMRALREGLQDARDDDDIAGLIVHIGTCPLQPSQCDELGRLLAAFGESKPVWAYTESFGELGTSLLPYVLASHAGQVWLQPSGQLGLGGVRAQITLLRGTLDKVGLEPQFGQRHEFKTAADTYAAHEISGPNREMIQRIADSVTDWAFLTIAERRKLAIEQVRAAADAGLLDAEGARSRGLVDRIGYRDEVYTVARQEWGGESAKLRYVHRYSKALSPATMLAAHGKPALAVVEVRGPIVTGRPQAQTPGGQRQAYSEIVCQQLRAAGRDPLVKAVLLRVDSPGGSYIASDAIRREVLQLRAGGRPVVATMGDVAASGGYFVAMPADEIVANPTTLTGSIGVLGGKFVSTELKSKIGLVMEDIVSGSWAGMMSPNQRFTDEQWAGLNERLDAIYADFTAKAARDRRLALDVLEPVARGRVWTGVDAQERLLVDHLGGMDLAIERACALAGVDRSAITIRAVSRLGFLSQFRPAESSEAVGGSVLMPTTPFGLDALVATIAEQLGLSSTGVLQLPYRINLR